MFHATLIRAIVLSFPGAFLAPTVAVDPLIETPPAVESPASPASPAPESSRDESLLLPPPPALDAISKDNLENLPLGLPHLAGNSASGSSRSWLLETLTALAIVILVIFGVRMALQRLSGRRGSANSGPLIEVLARNPIGPKSQVLFLRINQRIIVAAQTPSGMDTLTELSEPDDIAWVMGHVASNQPQSITRSFRNMLSRFDTDYATGRAADEGGDIEEQFVDRTRDQVSGLLSRIRAAKNRTPGDREA